MTTDIVWNGLELQADVYVPRHPSADDTPEVNGIRCTGVADEDEWAQFREDHEIETGDQQTDVEQAIGMSESDIADQMIQQARQSRRSHRRESRDVVEEAITQLVEQDRRNWYTNQGPIEKFVIKCVEGMIDLRGGISRQNAAYLLASLAKEYSEEIDKRVNVPS